MVSQNLGPNLTRNAAISVAELKTAEGLRLARRQHGLSQVELAELLRISQSNISRWENGYETIPHRFSLMLVDILSGNRGRVHPYLRRLAESDWRISILQLEKTGFYVDSRWLHLAENLARYFDIPKEESYMNLSSQFFDPDWRTKIYGSFPDDQIVSLEFERDCTLIAGGKKPRSCRLLSRQFVVDCDGYSRVSISISSILGPANGQAPRIISKSKLSDVGHFLPVQNPLRGGTGRPLRHLSVPMHNLGANMLSASKV